MGPSPRTTGDFQPDRAIGDSEKKLTRKERRAFNRKLKKPKYQKLAKKIIQSKTK